ncbi:MAG: hypothetical protein WCP28_20270 [Actinomycetes bacterium]
MPWNRAPRTQSSWTRAAVGIAALAITITATGCGSSSGGSTPTPTPTTPSNSASTTASAGSTTTIAAGLGTVCAVAGGGTAYCWGYNNNGSVGDGTNTESNTPAAVKSLPPNATTIATGDDTSCALLADGKAYCWGKNEFGELGGSPKQDVNGYIPTSPTTDSTSPVAVQGLPGPATTIATGGFSTCAIVTGGAAYCWGKNEFGALGNGTTTTSTSPTKVKNLPEPATSITTSSGTTCAVTSGGRAYCWGDNATGELGTGNTKNSPTPIQVKGLPEPVTAIATGSGTTCAIAGGSIYCWGNNKFGGVGNGTTANATRPVKVAGLAAGASSVTTSNGTTCAVVTPGAAHCWGFNNKGQLGNDSTTDSAIPVAVVGLPAQAKRITTGNQTTCAVVAPGNAYCWGDNEVGQLGNGTEASSTSPVPVRGL